MLLYYRIYHLDEQKPWVTLVHGAGGNSAIWFKQLKEYKKYFNVLLIDLRGHGKSKSIKWKDGDDLETVAEEVLDVLRHLHIERSHFIGISLGTVIIQTIAKLDPDRVETMVLGGAITKLNIRTKCYLTLGHLVKRIVPYMWIYRLFAWIIMPRSNHKEARHTFVSQAKTMCQIEFIHWLSLTKNVNPYLKELQTDCHGIPTLFLMGEQDYLFIENVEDIVLDTGNNVRFDIIDHAGHVCNIDQPHQFNALSISFIINNSRKLISIKTS
ncbi:alpha/beta fold hydrolase [Bacillus sp. 1P06AnD]|uniref:alpha/beta fold hydrolase n=1 Tax=Bacillus sp. 1P06AnD TaxID=3132208 RepID=UPI0039A01195